MAWTRVYPSAWLDRSVKDVRHPSAPACHPNAESCCYIIQNNRSLPMIDSTKSVKNAILRPRALAACNPVLSVLFATKRWLPFVYLAGMVLSASVPFVRAEVGRHLAVLVLILQILPAVTSLFVLRYDMHTREPFARLIYHDIRICVPAMASIGLSVPFLMDASYRGSRMFIVGAAGAAFAICSALVLVNFGWIDDMRKSVVFETRKCHVGVDDAFLNVMSTIAVLLIRNAIRKYQSLASKSQASTGANDLSVVTCITYHCRIELREATQSTIDPYDAESSFNATQMLQLRYAETGIVFDTTNVLIPSWITAVSVDIWRQRTQIWLRTSGALGLTSTLVGLLLPSPSPLSTIVSTVALVGTILFIGVYSAHFQRQLLIRLLHSFD